MMYRGSLDGVGLVFHDLSANQVRASAFFGCFLVTEDP